ncbi:hypothetical protein [Actinoallomurus sp. CA-150999]|uniref:hypothetical protein n=1 Tax=Actinoallomurus sp. CA-150999 TaxID=3239887 RepID=UPI003D91DD31
MSFIYVSHRLDEIARICDRIVVMRDGQGVASHPTAEVPVARLVEEMVGRSIERIFPDTGTARPREVLRVDGLTAADGSFREVSFEVREGEVLGIAGRATRSRPGSCSSRRTARTRAPCWDMTIGDNVALPNLDRRRW